MKKTLADFAAAILAADQYALEGALLALHGHRQVASGFEPDGFLYGEPMDIAFREGRVRPDSIVMLTGAGPIGISVRGGCLILTAWAKCPWTRAHRLVGRLASSGESGVTLEGDAERLKGLLANIARELNPPEEEAEPTLE